MVNQGISNTSCIHFVVARRFEHDVVVVVVVIVVVVVVVVVVAANSSIISMRIFHGSENSIDKTNTMCLPRSESCTAFQNSCSVKPRVSSCATTTLVIITHFRLVM